MTWICVKDILPPFFTDVLTFDGNRYTVGQYHDIEGWMVHKQSYRTVKYWTWLPPEPQPNTKPIAIGS